MNYCKAILSKVISDENDVTPIAESLLEAELKGVETHGLLRLPVYLERMLRGGINRCPSIKVLHDSCATMLLDADNACGQVAGKKGMRVAVEKAKQYGIGFVGVRNSNHFGIASYYSEMALEEKMVGFAMSNASPRLAPPGGASRELGNNPLSIAFPVPEGYPPIVIDMAVSVTAAGKIRLAAVKKEKIPPGWALDKNGKPTSDPGEALEGFLLPIGGHKGYALALAIDLLCGLLTGSEFGRNVGRIDEIEKPQKEGHIFGAIKITNFLSWDEYQERIVKYIHNLKNSRKAEGFSEIYTPGELEWTKKQQRLREGIALSGKTIKILSEAGKKMGIEPFEEM
jgi:LDH2 family malate/lactate/ureidoglycolate dehydrogenase